jgi:hypothetical protein
MIEVSSNGEEFECQCHTTLIIFPGATTVCPECKKRWRKSNCGWSAGEIFEEKETILAMN